MEKNVHQAISVSVTAVERRSGNGDRRRFARGGRRAGDIARVGVLALLCMLGQSVSTFAQTSVGFGFDVNSVRKARENGMPIAYGSLWAGPWNQRWGWGGIEDQLNTAKANGVTPVIQWFYWGDDISPSCVENGCWDAYSGVWKDKATWIRLSNELADLIARVMGPGGTAIVVTECEFNKGGIENYEAFDGYLADQAAIFHNRNLKVALEFGNWGKSSWPNFDRAVASSDLLGAMILYSSLRDPSTYQSGADLLLSQARYYQTTFDKPVFVTDFALSSYPEPTYETLQDIEVAEIFARMGEFRAAGVQGMVWRMLVDDPNFDTNNYHGVAERHWGLIRADGSRKASFTSFLNGMLAEGQSTELPAAPANLTASAGNAQATLTWSGVSGATSYNVLSSTTSGGPYQTVAVNVGATSDVHTGLVNGVKYYYVVTAQNAPAPAPLPSGQIDIWWPTPGVAVMGTQPFKALLQGKSLSSYRMYWQVDGGRLNQMYDSNVDYPHKEAIVSVTGWNWHGQGPYMIQFVAKDKATGKTLATRQTTIYVR